MKVQDLPRLTAVMLKLQSVFTRDLNEHTYDAYFEALRDWKIEYIEKAALHFINTSTFFPLPKDFRAWLSDYGWNPVVFIGMREVENSTPTVKELLDEADKQNNKT